jgi:hypothetical protein
VYVDLAPLDGGLKAVTFSDDVSVYFVSGESYIDLSRIGRS